MSEIVLELTKAGYTLAQPSKETPVLDLHESATGVMGNVTDNLMPVALGGAAALVAAEVVNGFTKPGIVSGLVKGVGGGLLMGVDGKWAKYAGAFLIFDGILDIIPLDKMLGGITGNIFGGGGGMPPPVIAAQQSGGAMNIDQLYSYLRHNA